MSAVDELSPEADARGAVASRVVARHLLVLATAVACVGAVYLSGNLLAVFALGFLPAVSVAVARVTIAPLATTRKLVDGYHLTTFVLLALWAVGPWIGPVTLTAVAFVWLGWLQRSPRLAGVSLATVLAVAPIDVMGPFGVFADTVGAGGHVLALVVVALSVAGTALWWTRADGAGTRTAAKTR